MKKVIFEGKFERGYFIPNSLKAWQQTAFGLEGKQINITIELLSKNRSNSQNAYYWGVVIETAHRAYIDSQHDLMSKEDWHSYFKKEFNYKEIINEKTGEIIRIPATTANLDTKAFSEYVEFCCKEITRIFNIAVPTPIDRFYEEKKQ